MRDLTSNVKVTKGVAPINSTVGVGALTANNVDLQGFISAIVELSVGAKHGSDTINSTNKWTLKLEHADDDGTGVAGAYGNVATADIIGATPSSGVVLTIDAENKMAQVYQYGYVGGKRFIKATLTPAGTIANGTPMCVNVLKGHPAKAPV
jgi:hypothetical protein